MPKTETSAQMLAHNARQLKHRDLRLAEHRKQLGVGVDVALVGGVLQVFGFDVVRRSGKPKGRNSTDKVVLIWCRVTRANRLIV